jgi:CRP-like cAMP-binding protein
MPTEKARRKDIAHSAEQLAEPNRLLRAIPPTEYTHVASLLEPVMLATHDVIFEPNKPIAAVYFLGTGVASMVTTMQDGATVETSTVGNDGMVGIPLLLGVWSVPTRCFIQIAGDGKKMDAAGFTQAVVECGGFRTLLLKYAQVLFNQVAQSAACNRVHSVEQRCARWLLMTRDRVNSDIVPLTHEFLSYMLGVRRESVSVAAEALQQSGLIEYRRGKITIRDRAGLAAASCECYAIVRASFEELFAPDNADA